jgi:hypothetical protein
MTPSRIGTKRCRFVGEHHQIYIGRWPCGLPGIRTNQRDGENIFLGSCPLSSHFNDALGVLVIVACGRSRAFPAACQKTDKVVFWKQLTALLLSLGGE